MDVLIVRDYYVFLEQMIWQLSFQKLRENGTMRKTKGYYPLM